jgi:hypothetical protein
VRREPAASLQEISAAKVRTILIGTKKIVPADEIARLTAGRGPRSRSEAS